MKICKYCKKPISNPDVVWNTDSEGNGYHYDCLCEMEFRSRDRQVYNKGKVDVLDRIRAEIVEYKDDKIIHAERNEMIDTVLEIIDKYKAESEDDE